MKGNNLKKGNVSGNFVNGEKKIMEWDLFPDRKIVNPITKLPSFNIQPHNAAADGNNAQATNINSSQRKIQNSNTLKSMDSLSSMNSLQSPTTSQKNLNQQSNKALPLIAPQPRSPVSMEEQQAHSTPYFATTTTSNNNINVNVNNGGGNMFVLDDKTKPRMDWILYPDRNKQSNYSKGPLFILNKK